MISGNTIPFFSFSAEANDGGDACGIKYEPFRRGHRKHHRQGLLYQYRLGEQDLHY